MIIRDREFVKYLVEKHHYILAGYFDGSVMNAHRFPQDASMYLLLLDPKSMNGKGIDLPIE
jgi:hypothetical protein